MVDRPDYAKEQRNKAIDGYNKQAWQLVEGIYFTLKDGKELTETQAEHLLDCLKRTVNKRDAQEGFYLQKKKGGQKKDTKVRDVAIVEIFKTLEKTGLNYDACLEQTRDTANYYFAKVYGVVDVKFVGAKVTESNKKS